VKVVRRGRGKATSQVRTMEWPSLAAVAVENYPDP